MLVFITKAKAHKTLFYLDPMKNQEILNEHLTIQNTCPNPHTVQSPENLFSDMAITVLWSKPYWKFVYELNRRIHNIMNELKS